MKTEAARKRVMEAGTCRCNKVVRFKHVIQQTFDTRSFNGLKKEDRGVLIMIRVYLLIFREMSVHFCSLLLPITCSSDFHHAWKIFNTDFRQPFMFHQKIHNFSSKPDDQYCFLKNISL